MRIRFLLACLFLSLTPLCNHAKYNPLFGLRSRPDYPCPDKSVKNMNEEELNKVLVYAKAIEDQELVFKCYFYLIGVSGQQDSIKGYKLGLADYCFSLEDYEKAAGCYEEFFILYPGSQEAEYAQYKSILCSFYLTLSSDRDQTLSLKTISLIQLFLQRAKNATFINEVQEIYVTCRQKLFEHEVHVFEHYLSRKKFTSAEQRLLFIEKNFQDIAHIEQYLAYCKEMMEIVKNPETRPFFLNFDLKKALPKHENLDQASQKVSVLHKISSFFLA